MFIRHTSCPKCGSSDALALYQGGSSFCFSCRTSRRGSTSPYITSSINSETSGEVDEKIILPDDVSFNYAPICVDWISKYGVSVDELIKNKVYWSEEKQQLIFTFWDEAGNFLLWQARNFGRWSKIKYITKGKPDQILPIYQMVGLGGIPKLQIRLVIVEDCISAIKCSRVAASMPVLGSSLSLNKLTRLSHLPGLSSVVVWLDGNMYDKAQQIAKRLQLLGLEARAIWTKADPKEYENEEISMLLQNSS